MERDVIGLPGSTEGPFEFISHEFKLRLRSLTECFPPAKVRCLDTGTE